MNSSKSFLQGTLFLTLANLLARLIGFYNRIFLAHRIGAHQMGIYQFIFPLYLVGFSLCFQGFQTAMTKMVAAKHALGKDREGENLFLVTTGITVGFSLLVLCLSYFLAPSFCRLCLHEPQCIPCLRLMMCLLPFVGIKACIHGYFLGLGKSCLPSKALCLEQVVRVGTMLLLSSTLYPLLKPPALLAILSMMAGELVALCYTLCYHHQHIRLRRSYRLSFEPSLIKPLFSLSTPLTINALSLTLLQSIQNLLIPTMLTLYYHQRHYAMTLYGIFSGMVLPFILFPATVTNALSLMLLPKISSIHTHGQGKTLKRAITYSLCFCLILGLMSCLGFYLLGPWLGETIFRQVTCGQWLRQLSILCPFIYVQGTLTAILNGMGHTKVTLLHQSLSLFLQLGFIVLGIPQGGISIYFIGLAISMLLHVLSNFIFLCHQLTRE